VHGAVDITCFKDFRAASEFRFELDFIASRRPQNSYWYGIKIYNLRGCLKGTPALDRVIKKHLAYEERLHETFKASRIRESTMGEAKEA
jgi:hypothetical protein